MCSIRYTSYGSRTKWTRYEAEKGIHKTDLWKSTHVSIKNQQQVRTQGKSIKQPNKEGKDTVNKNNPPEEQQQSY